MGDIHYLNSGDWVESLSAIVEHSDGRFELLGYDQFLDRLAVDRGASGSAERAQDRGKLALAR